MINIEELRSRATRLLELLAENSASDYGCDNVTYLAYVIQSWYEEGYKDALENGVSDAD